MDLTEIELKTYCRRTSHLQMIKIMKFRAMDPLFMSQNCSLALETKGFCKSGKIRLTNNDFCDVDFFMQIFYKWRRDKIRLSPESPLMFHSLNMSLVCKTWRFSVIALAIMEYTSIRKEDEIRKEQEQFS